MGADASIAMGFKPPQLDNGNRLAQMMEMDQADRQNRLADMQFAKYGKEQATENKLSQIYIDAKGDPAAVSQAMYAGGHYKEGMAFDKANAEAKGAGYKMENDKLEGVKRQTAISQEQRTVATQKLGAHLNNPNLSKDSLMADIQTQVQTGELPADKAQALIGQIPDDPAQIKVFLNKILTGLQTGDQQLSSEYKAKKDAAEEGTPVDVMRGGKPVKIMSKGGRVLGEAVPSKGMTVNMGSGKPMPAAALKMQQEELDAIGAFSGINSDMGAIESQLKGGKLEFGPVSNLTAKARNMAGMSNEKSVNFASFQSTMEKMRNASLMLNKGVQTDGDAQRAWNELFANINDKGVVTQRLAEIKKINERAVNIRKMNVDQIRSNYRAEPLDTAEYENQGAALGGTQPGATQPGRTQSGATTSGW